MKILSSKPYLGTELVLWLFSNEGYTSDYVILKYQMWLLAFIIFSSTSWSVLLFFQFFFDSIAYINNHKYHPDSLINKNLLNTFLRSICWAKLMICFKATFPHFILGKLFMFNCMFIFEFLNHMFNWFLLGGLGEVTNFLNTSVGVIFKLLQRPVSIVIKIDMTHKSAVIC